MLKYIYLAHFFGWWTMLLFLGTARKQFVFNVFSTASVAAGALIYAVPSAGFHYFLKHLLN